MGFESADQFRTFEDLIWIGTVVEWKHEDGIHWGRVERQRASGKNTSGWLAMREHRASDKTRTSCPFEVGEQVVVICPSGEIDNGIVLTAVPKASASTPADTPDRLKFLLSDDDYLEYDRTTRTLTIKAENIRIIGPVEQRGGDMTSDGISAQHHAHDRVRAGVDRTGEPQR